MNRILRLSFCVQLGEDVAFASINYALNFHWFFNLFLPRGLCNSPYIICTGKLAVANSAKQFRRARLSLVMNAGSHTAEGSIPELFVENKKPIRFYVDPGSVINRPKLIRLLKSAGASIASDPKSSDLILVQSDATSGQRFVRDWAAEKKVLEAKWVYDSVSAGRLLKESDQWGGCLAAEDLSVVLDELPSHNLPTPRITPVEQVEQTPNNWPSNGPPPYPNPQYPNHSAPGSRHSSQQPSGMNGPIYSNNIPHQQPILQNQIPQFPQQPGMQQPFPPQMPHFSNGIAFDPAIYAAALMDVMQRWPGLPPQAQGPGMQNMFFPQGMNPMMNPMMHSQPPGLMPAAYDQSHLPALVLDPLPPSLSRKSSVDLKGKGKITPHSRLSSSSSRAVGPSTSMHDIFTSDSGEPLTFYVAVDVHKRADVVNHIKRHGGQMSTQTTTADFGVLAFRSQDFGNHLEIFTCSDHGTAVRPAFVFDSVEQNTLLDPSPYQFELPEKLQRKIQKSAPPSPAKATAVKKPVGSQKAKSHKKKTAAVKKEVREERDSSSESRPHVASPSPPPVHTRVLLNGDKYRYPEVEADYVRRYATVLLNRDHQMPFTALSAKLHAKMPHHSVNAWTQYVSQTLRNDIDQIRKRAIIAFRKEQHEQTQRTSQEEPPAKRRKAEKDADADSSVTDGSTAAAAGPSAAAAPRAEAPGEDAEELDLNAVAHFFANGGDAEQSDEEGEPQSVKDARVWARLTEQGSCRTEESWEIFYNKHHARVMQLYELLIGAEEEGSPPE
ncbi:hypothetical protein DFH07DRAFT_201069 [Mycena maculata]|uniref:BRCT domain-containing protein n=1 Tax=Mycena maculata TaxID=230809 RepID=A0AAD7P179_9AGAR|nr:hypothetical protein DFH07DRAFT_201069 [Mycena maculata]